MSNAEVTLHTDGGARGNPGPAAIGVVIKTPDGHTAKELGIYIGKATNNDAEYQNHFRAYIKGNYRLDSVDFIKASEPLKVLAENDDKDSINALKRKILASMEQNNSKLIAIIGCESFISSFEVKDCQLANLRSSVNTVRFWNLNVKVIGLWIDSSNVISDMQ